jgi:hypothetical protein
LGYKPGLIEWALDGPYIVVAANQWSVQGSDVLACLQWVIDQNDLNTADGREYVEVVDTKKLGLAGHSQGGGAVIYAGDGEPNGLAITATIPMNPYGPSWVDPGNQDGPMMLIGGSEDTTTPTSSFRAVFDATKGREGGLLAELQGGTHNSEGWGVDPLTGDTLNFEGAREHNFGEYQKVTEPWWQFHLNGHARSGGQLKRLLDRDPWITEYTFIEGGFDLD